MLTWQDVMNDKSLQDLPYKIELNKQGKIEMSPASNMHGTLQFEVGQMLSSHLPAGRVIAECSIATSEGVRVADVAWCSRSFLERFGYDTPYVEAPETCVEIASPSNSATEMDWKTDLYLRSGAQEVWVVDLDGNIRFFGKEGLRSASMFGGFAVKIDLPYRKKH